jgi:hypothetical protein
MDLAPTLCAFASNFGGFSQCSWDADRVEGAPGEELCSPQLHVVLSRLQGKPEESQEASFVIHLGPAAHAKRLQRVSYRDTFNSQSLAKLRCGQRSSFTQESAESFLG